MLKIKKGTSSYACHAKARFNSLRRTKIGQQNACSKERLRTQARFLIHVKLNIALHVHVSSYGYVVVIFVHSHVIVTV